VARVSYAAGIRGERHQQVALAVQERAGADQKGVNPRLGQSIEGDLDLAVVESFLA
jgi:hypothetical protein